MKSTHKLLSWTRWAAAPAIAVPALLLSACAGMPSKQSHLPDLLGLRTQARQAYVDGDLHTAEADYQRLIAAVPQEALYRFRLGNVEARLAQPEAAVKAYRAALLRQPSMARAWHNLGIVRLRQAQAALIQSARLAKDNRTLALASAELAEALNALPIGAHNKVSKAGAHADVATVRGSRAVL